MFVYILSKPQQIPALWLGLWRQWMYEIMHRKDLNSVQAFYVGLYTHLTTVYTRRLSRTMKMVYGMIYIRQVLNVVVYIQ